MAVLMSRGLALRDNSVTYNSVHPGTVKTEFAEKYTGFMTRIFPVIYALFERKLSDGAATQVYVATQETESGRYYSNCQVWRANPVSEDDQLCRAFCDLCDKLVKPWVL